MTISEVEAANRQRRQLADLAIGHATRGDWEAAVQANRELLELGPDTDAYNRLGKALAELGRHAEALEAYEQALARDATNRTAERNVERLRVLADRNPESADGAGEAARGAVTSRPEWRAAPLRRFRPSRRRERCALTPAYVQSTAK